MYVGTMVKASSTKGARGLLRDREYLVLEERVDPFGNTFLRLDQDTSFDSWYALRRFIPVHVEELDEWL